VQALRNSGFIPVRATGALLALAATCVGARVAALANDPLAPLPAELAAPSDAQQVIDWVQASRDNGGRPFMVVDKLSAEVFVFDAQGQLAGRTPVLIGSAKGDDSAPGIGERELRDIPPSERTTPAGRFVAKYGPASGQEKVLWVDWTTAVSMHPVATGNKRERRLQRLASATPDDNRITYGCINVPRDFYRAVVAPTVADGEAIVYILPEERTIREVFLASAPAIQLGKAE
jgi:hypothetical protein